MSNSLREDDILIRLIEASSCLAAFMLLSQASAKLIRSVKLEIDVFFTDFLVAGVSALKAVLGN